MRSSADEMHEPVGSGLANDKVGYGTSEGAAYPASAVATHQMEPPIDTPATTAKTLAQVWRDVLIVMVLAAGIGFASFQGAQRIDPAILTYEITDLWFDADIPNVYMNMSTRYHDAYRTKKHPLFPLVTFPPTKVLHILGIEKIVAVKIVIAAVASLWISALFILLRLIGCYRFDATLFSLLAATSASAMFWFVVPETFSFGSLTILLALCTVALAQHLKLSPLWYVIVSALTLSVTLTNWMVGILATFASFQWRRALQISVNAFCLVVFLWWVQKFVFPTAGFFLEDHRSEAKLIISRGQPDAVRSFVFHTMVMPAIEEGYHPFRPGWPMMTIQRSRPGSGSPWGIVAVGLWAALLGLGFWGLVSTRLHPQLRVVLGLTLLGQLGLHLIYGLETFVYSLHFAPLLVVAASLSTLTRTRPIALVLAGALAVSAGINNAIQFNKATEFIQRQVTARRVVQSSMLQRPADRWPRSRGHVVLAMPGSRDVDKAYHEPGGTFSPAVGSFGVSIWLADMQGTLRTSSDKIPLNLIRQQFGDCPRGSARLIGPGVAGKCA